MEAEVRISPGMCELLADWHGGQKSACYTLLESGSGSPSLIQQAIVELSKIEPRYKDKMDNDLKTELRGLILSLKKLIPSNFDV